MARDIPKAYNPAEVEQRLYEWWEESGFFYADSESSRPRYSMVLPPPNVTGSLHMGHALNITLQDILARWKRMQGFNVLWVPGTDHAGIATQNVVERQLATEGKKRTDLGREEFEEVVWKWKEVSENNILQQIRRLGCSCDWSRQRFTLDEGLSRAVREVFVRLYEAGLIYRGEYLVNWCIRCGTAISDLEVEYEPSEGSLWHIEYPLKGNGGSVVVATTRPETMLGDTAVAVHPDDERFQHLAGKKIVLPLMGREIPVIFDSFVDSEFGTGAVKVTPGHDPADFEAGKRQGLDIVKVIGDDGRMTSAAGEYTGLDRYEARKKVVEDLKAEGLLVKEEKHSHNVGRCQRCQKVVEPLVSKQWFVKVRPLAEPAINAVEEARTVFYPENYKKVYFEWMHNIHDWCISRQLWWGHRIPAWHCENCQQTIVAREEPSCCPKCKSASLLQETDVLDTWFSSGLWPFSTLGWPEETDELKQFYPTSTLVTGFDIIFFWVARMMMMGLRFKKEVPFRKVYINGLVRDSDGQKMSKSRGNIIDPLEIIDEYGTDAVRFTLAVMAVPGTDIPFSISRMSGYRAFCNKIWNAARFLLMNLEITEPVSEKEIEVLREAGELTLEDRWILSRLTELIESTDKDIERFYIHEASNSLYHFFWHEVCDWYLELVKPAITNQEGARKEVAEKMALFILESSLRLLHPLIPFITEELWQQIPHSGESIMTSSYPRAQSIWIDPEVTEQMQSLQELITAMRTARAENKIDPRQQVDIEIVPAGGNATLLENQKHHIENLVGTKKLHFAKTIGGGKVQIQGVSSAGEFAIDLEGVIDLSAELKRMEKEKERTVGEFGKLSRKLQNEAFLTKAPKEVVQKTQQRHQEVGDKLKKIEEKLDMLSGSGY